MKKTTTTPRNAEDKLVLRTSVSAEIQAEAHALTVPPFSGPLTAETYNDAVLWYKTAKQKIAEVERWFEDLKRPLNQARSIVLSKERETLTPPRAMLAQVAAWITAYREILDRVRREEEERQRRVAEEKAEAERRAQVEALERAAAAQRSEAARTALQEQARSLEAAPITPTYTPLPAPAVQESGISDRTTWRAEVQNFERLVLAVAVGIFLEKREEMRQAGWPLPAWMDDWPTASIEYLQPNETALNRVAVRCREEIPIPGVRGVKRTTLITR